MPGSSSRFAVSALLLGLLSAAPARGAEREAYLDLTPTRAMRLAAASVHGPEIPGVTYPHSAPPDLVARDTPRLDVGAVPHIAPAEAAHASTAIDAIETGLEVAADVKLAPVVQETTLKLDVDLATQRLTVTERGEVKFVWPISSGRAPYATKVGTFRPQWASRMWYSRQYDMAPMPHAVFFNGGIAFHATQATHLLGRPASHGCVRLSPKNASALYAMIHAHGYGRTEIVVAGSPKVAGSTPRETERRAPRPARMTGAPASPLVWSFF